MDEPVQKSLTEILYPVVTQALVQVGQAVSGHVARLVGTPGAPWGTGLRGAVLDQVREEEMP